ncbi:MAG TPA: hypothetical protein VI612_00560 [Candidatus Nanoarchaeia archaeon]|nr:hypothetical protein [Candidatus Nanoarchaeia archaeon]
MVMSEQPETIIRHRGFFNYSDLQRSIRKWFADEDFNVVEYPSLKQKFATPTGVEQEFKVKAHKNITGYIRFHIELLVRVYDLRDIEIIREGHKVQLQDGKIFAIITPTLEFDWQKRYGGSKFLQALDDFYRNYIIKYKIKDYWEDMILIKSTMLAQMIKETLGQEVM